MSDLEVSVDWGENLCRVRMSGEARLETATAFDQVRHEIAERGVNRVLVDMSDLEFMDSASAGMLLRLRSQIRDANGVLVLHGLRRMVSRLLERTGLDEQFDCVETAAQAEARLA